MDSFDIGTGDDDVPLISEATTDNRKKMTMRLLSGAIAIVFVVIVVSVGVSTSHHKEPTVISDLKPTVESSKDYGHDYRGSLLLENSCEGKNPSNYWLSPDGKTGEEASIILNLGRVAQFNSFNIKNTHNGNSNDRGAKNIGLYTSNSKNGPWKLVAEKLMADARNKDCNVPVEEVTIGTTDAQFIKLVINSYYGAGGGLQYLGVDRVSELKQIIDEKEVIITELKQIIDEKEVIIKHKEATITNLEATNQRNEAEIRQNDAEIQRKEAIIQNQLNCPIDGAWSTFSEFGQCSATCGQGIKERTRTCTNPPPQHGGQQCQGVSKETENCVLVDNCPCKKEDNYDYSGNDIEKWGRETTGQEDCANWCGAVKECKAWTLKKSDNWCWIKRSDAGRSKNNLLISGTKGCATGTLSGSTTTIPKMTTTTTTTPTTTTPTTTTTIKTTTTPATTTPTITTPATTTPATTTPTTTTPATTTLAGVVGDWSSWSDCTATCGNATKTRTRSCQISPCHPFVKEETVTCHLPPCNSRPCTFASDCPGNKAKCQRGKCVTPSDSNFECSFASDCYDNPKTKCQRNKCVTPSDFSFECSFASDCYDKPKTKCQRGKCVNPSDTNFECSFNSDCYHGADCSFGKCVADRFMSRITTQKPPTKRPTGQPPQPSFRSTQTSVSPSNRTTRPNSRPCTFASDCPGNKAKCQRGKCLTPSDFNFECSFASDCYDKPKTKCQQNKCVTPSDFNFECSFASDCYDKPRTKCQQGKCVTPSDTNFECSFSSDCYDGANCSFGKCVVGRFGW